MVRAIYTKWNTFIKNIFKKNNTAWDFISFSLKEMGAKKFNICFSYNFIQDLIVFILLPKL